MRVSGIAEMVQQYSEVVSMFVFTIALSEQHDFLVVLEELVQVIGRNLDTEYTRSVIITIAFKICYQCLAGSLWICIQYTIEWDSIDTAWHTNPD